MPNKLSAIRSVFRAAVLTAVATTMLLTVPGAATAKELRFVHAYPVASQHHRNVEWFTSEVTKRTNGEVTFRIFPSAQIMPINQELPGILAGQVSMTYSVAPIAGSVEPLWGIFDLPFLFDVKIDDVSHGRRFFESEKGGGILKKAMEARGFKLISIAPTDHPSGIYLTSANAVEKLEDLKGLKIRIPGGHIGKIAGKAFGFSPIAISGAELVTALTQGVVDGANVPPIYTHDNKLPFKSMTVAPYSWPGVTPIIMSLAEYNSLTNEQKKTLLNVGAELEKRALNIIEATGQDKIETLKAAGMKVVTLSPEETARWVERGQSIWEIFARENGPDARTMLEEAKRLRNVSN